ncbi:MAG TPA: homogentisate 1,2-dioxygenase [Vicinamibacteria bacterium]|nr:homogentisate 1,2-dioxygenase [Vicinamibacteria bacterium]
MPIYHRLGRVPRKRHLAFRKDDGSLLYEELVGNQGFTGPSSLLYHLRLPTSVASARPIRGLGWVTEPDRVVRHRHFRTSGLATGASAVLDRVPLLFNADVAIEMARPRKEDPFFYRNGQGDEVVFVAEGDGVLESGFGELPYRPGDYVVIPRGIAHRWRLGKGPHRLLVVESAGYARTPRRYRNEHGQLTEMAPFSERDIRRPENLVTRDETGEFPVVVKSGNRLVEFVMTHHPFDVVGWDGYYYPWAFSIHDFEPRVGRLHLPPPVHQTFEGDGWVMCSFCPRPFDFEPGAIPAPYTHQNVMSDEVIFYANSEFMSRKGIELGSITLHPDGLPHGPQPGKTEQSIGAKGTDELAVMIDTFRPLLVSREALAIEDATYQTSWLEPPSRELPGGRDEK